MTLLDAPRYDAARARRLTGILIGAAVAVLLVAVVAVAGEFSGHGWFFNNLGIEHRVSNFLTDVQDNKLEDAYALWRNDPNWKNAPPDPNYDFTKFKEDWGPASTDGAIRNFAVHYSKRTGSGCIVAYTINGQSKNRFLWYQFSTKRLGFSPLEIKFGLQ